MVLLYWKPLKYMALLTLVNLQVEKRLPVLAQVIIKRKLHCLFTMVTRRTMARARSSWPGENCSNPIKTATEESDPSRMKVWVNPPGKAIQLKGWQRVSRI